MSLNTLFKEYTTGSESNTERLFSKIKNALATKGNPLDAFQQNIFSFESAPEHTKSEISYGLEELKETLSNAVAGIESYDESSTGFKAGLMGATAANNPAEVYRATSEKPKGDKIIEPFMLSGGIADVGRVNTALEAYDNTEIKNTMMLSFSYNLKAARQDAFGEAYYPTVVVAPDVATITISVDLLNVMEDQKRNLDGSYDHQFNRKSLVTALVYPDILNNDTTRIYPVVLDGNARSLANFVDPSDVQPKTVVLEDGNTVKTAPLKIGAHFDLLGLGSAEYLIGNGALDFTDQIDPSVKLSAIYLKFKDGSVVKYDNLEVMPAANFTYGVQGNNRTVVLTFDTRSIYIRPTTTKIDGSPLTNAAVTNNLAVALNLSVYGKVNLDTGRGQLNAGAVTVESIYTNANGKGEHDRISTETGVGATVLTEFDGVEVIGYDLIARRINSNRRERGQILDINHERLVYGLPTLAPISVVRPVPEGDVKDSDRLNALVAATYIRCSNAAVDALLATEAHLASLPPNYEPELLYSSEALGAARFFVTPWYDSVDLDVMKELNVLRSADRILDVHAVILNTIRELTFRAYVKSNYSSAADVLQGDSKKKPLVIIGTDPYIAAYIQMIGDTRTLGDEFDFKIVSTPNVRMSGRIIIAFGKNNPTANDIANPLHFGNMFWRPEITSILPISRNGQISREMTVQPSFIHVSHCPVMASVRLYNLKAAVTQMVPLSVHEV